MGIYIYPDDSAEKARRDKMITIKIYSDYIWPFCYIGKGIADKLKEDFVVQEIWQGLEIHPETPPEGRDISAEYPPEIRSQLYHRLNEMGKGYGVCFNRSDGYLPNSRRALMLSEYAKGTSSFSTLHLKIFKAYFEEGRNIGDPEVLIGLAETSGISREEVEQAWQDESLKQQLQEIAAIAHREGATGGVPTFIINDRYKIVGAQPYNVFQETLQKIVAENNR